MGNEQNNPMSRGQWSPAMPQKRTAPTPPEFTWPDAYTMGQGFVGIPQRGMQQIGGMLNSAGKAYLGGANELQRELNQPIQKAYDTFGRPVGEFIAGMGAGMGMTAPRQQPMPMTPEEQVLFQRYQDNVRNYYAQQGAQRSPAGQGVPLRNAPPYAPGSPTPQEPQVVQQVKPQGIPVSPAAIQALRDGGVSLGIGASSRTSAPAPVGAPGGSFQTQQSAGPKRTYQPMPEFQSPGYVDQITGGDLAKFLALPEQVSFDLSQLSRAQTFGLRPEQVSQALNTEMAYRKMQQEANQQQFANRVQQLGIAGGLDDKAAAAFSQRLVDEARNISTQEAIYNYEYGETPEEKRIRDAEVALQLAQQQAKYKHDLDMQKVYATARIAAKSDKLSGPAKEQIAMARDIIDEFRNSMPQVDIMKEIQSGNMEAIYNALQSGALKPQTAAHIQSLPWAVDTLVKAQYITGGGDVGIDEELLSKGASSVTNAQQQVIRDYTEFFK